MFSLASNLFVNATPDLSGPEVAISKNCSAPPPPPPANNGRISSLDIAKFVAACFIPCLHVGLGSREWGYWICNYVARLGVPLFFAVSGVLLGISCEKHGNATAWKRYISRVGKILLIWTLIYLPLLVFQNSFSSFAVFVKKMLFMTPAFLWYLTALMFASVPFCFIRNRRWLFVLAGCGYVAGTVFSANYKWCFGSLDWYERVFYTTRNGLFMGLFLMCMGELACRCHHRFSTKACGVLLALSLLSLYAEVFFVGRHVDLTTDRSQYFLLPPVVFFGMCLLLRSDFHADTAFLAEISTMMYVMQYGFVMFGVYVLGTFGLCNDMTLWFLAVMGPCVFHCCFKRTILAKILF